MGDGAKIRKVALVTGAGRGIGRAIALGLGRAGIKVCVNYHMSSRPAEDVVKQIQSDGGSALKFRADVTDIDAIENMIDTVVKDEGRLDILVNNAGLGLTSMIVDTEEQVYDRLFAMAKGTYFAMKRAALVMGDGGRIVSLSSMATRYPRGMAAYAGSKAAVEQFTRGLAHEIGCRGITVNALLVGTVVTDMVAGLDQAALDRIAGATALRRIGTAEDIADAVVFLASDAGRWITGECIGVGGGLELAGVSALPALKD